MMAICRSHRAYQFEQPVQEQGSAVQSDASGSGQSDSLYGTPCARMNRIVRSYPPRPGR